MESPKRIKVIRMDDLPMTGTYYTTEGYLVDHPILTCTGIFEYRNPDGSIRRELRLPQDVFDRESLESYMGKPIVITHDAGLIDKDNVAEESIGTILSEGYRDGDNVKAAIVIHDTDRMKESRLKELSVGYNLELEETPGIWHGMPYDAIQRNIRVNHLALVREARAGEQVRLNIDSRDAKTILIGGRKTRMAKTKKSVRDDSVLSDEEKDKAIAKYLKFKEQKEGVNEDDAPQDEEAVATEKAPAKVTPKDAPVPAKVAPKGAPVIAEEDDEETPMPVTPAKPVPAPIAETAPKAEAPKAEPGKTAPQTPAPKRMPVTIGSLSKGEEEDEDDTEDMSVEDRIGAVKDKVDKLNKQEVPDNEDDVNEVIGAQGMTINELMDLIDTLLAERDYNAQKADCADVPKKPIEEPEDYSEDSEDEEPEDEEDEGYEDYPEDEEEDSEDEPEDDADYDEPEDDTDEDYEDNEDEDDTEDDYSDTEDEEDEDYEDNEDEDDTDDSDDFEHTDCGYSKKKAHADSTDKQVRQRVKACMIGKELNLDGLEGLPLPKAKRKIIHAARPDLRLDGKSEAYIDAIYDMTCADIKSRKKDINYQYKQMFNADSKKVFAKPESSDSARQRMINKIIKV